MNWLNAHATVRRLSDSITELFSALYLYQLGLPLPTVFWAWGGIFGLRLLLRPFTFTASQHLGMRAATALGMLLLSGQYFFLSQVSGLTPWLLAYVFYFALAQSFYWTNYHTLVATLGDHAHRGKQVGVREAAGALAGVIAPLVSGFTVAQLGFHALFAVATGLALVAAGLLWALPTVPRPPRLSLKIALKTVSLQGLRMYFCDAWQYYFYLFTWNLVLFGLLKNYAQFGGLMGLAVAFQAVGLLFFGHRVDGGAGRKLATIGMSTLLAVLLGRYFLGFTVPAVIGLDVLLAVGYTLYLPAYHTCVYNSGKASGQPAWFHFFGEIGWDCGAVAALGLAGALLSAGLELRDLLLFGVLGQLGLLAQIWRYYRAHPRAKVVEQPPE